MSKPIARLGDPVKHPLPPVLTGAPVSPNVIIGMKPAWLGVNPATAAVLKAAKEVSNQIVDVAEKATLAASGTPAQPGLKAAEEAIKASVAASMGSMISSMAAGGSIHACVTPYPPIPHGPGVVIDGSTSVVINNLPACFQGNTIIEALGTPPNEIMMGCPQVLIGSGPPASAPPVDSAQIKAKMQADADKAGKEAEEKKNKEIEEEEKKKKEEAEKKAAEDKKK